MKLNFSLCYKCLKRTVRTNFKIRYFHVLKCLFGYIEFRNSSTRIVKVIMARINEIQISISTSSIRIRPAKVQMRSWRLDLELKLKYFMLNSKLVLLQTHQREALCKFINQKLKSLRLFIFIL